MEPITLEVTVSGDWKRTISGKRLKPESLMMSYGYEPKWSEGSVKSPIFQTSTFAFQSAEEGKAFFELAYGLREANPGEKPGLIYSRINNPDLEILEDRLALWDDADGAAVFSSGMAAITTTLLSHLRPGDAFLYSRPVYGGVDHFATHVLPDLGITPIGFPAGASAAEIKAAVDEHDAADHIGFMLIETPANPTNMLVDIEMCAAIAAGYSTKERKVLLGVDNTFLGPVFQHPMTHGADLTIYSATKYIGGHSDLVAGAVCGATEALAPVLAMRTFLGNAVGPWTGWLLMRSLETLKLRMTRQAETAQRVAPWLVEQPQVESVMYLGLLRSDDPQMEIYKRQCHSPGAMISILLKGGEAEAFRFLNALSLVKLAVSLGGTESLAQHPCTMTHADVPLEEKIRLGVGHNLVRLSIGVEDADDLILDLAQALEAV
jgi:methionine-gamma-lyase